MHKNGTAGRVVCTVGGSLITKASCLLQQANDIHIWLFECRPLAASCTVHNMAEESRGGAALSLSWCAASTASNT